MLVTQFVLSLCCETKTGFLIIGLVGRSFKAKCSGDIYFGCKVIFCSCSVISSFLSFNFLQKKQEKRKVSGFKSM